MKLRIYLFLLVIILFSVTAKSQISVSIGPRTATESFSTAVPIVFALPKDQTFRTDELSKQFPASKIPVETLKINFPVMINTKDTLGILWYLKPENYSARGEVNVIIIGIAADSTKTYYIDNNNDRTFADNEDKFVFMPDVQKKLLEIKILGGYYNYTLMNPDFYIAPEPPSRIGYYNEVWKKSIKKPALIVDVAILTGGGDAEISITPMVPNIKEYQYVANIFGCVRPSVGLDLSWYNFHIGGTGDYELLQYESTVRYDYSDKFKTTKHFDLGWWTRTKLHATVYAEYDVRLFNTILISPFAAYSWDKNIDDRRFEKSVPPSQLPADAGYKDMYSQIFGFKIKLPVAEKGLIYLKTAFSRSYFDATDYLPAFEEGSYSVDYTQVYFGVGMNYRITK
jgi:hypothetical protein